MYDVNKYLNPPKRKPKRAFYRDTPIVHDDETRKSHDVTNGYDDTSHSDNEINHSGRKYTAWDSRTNEFVVKTVEADEDRNHEVSTGRRKHTPGYENLFRIDTSSSVFITRRKTSIDISGASDELEEEIQSKAHLLPINVTITLDEYFLIAV